jgi:hypothetical protein
MDFDYWSNLYKTDPQRFTQERQQAAQQVIDNAPHHLRVKLQRLQWLIDTTIATSKTPLQSAVRLSKMMDEKFLEMNYLLCQATGQRPPVVLPRSPRQCKIYQFTKNAGTN